MEGGGGSGGGTCVLLVESDEQCEVPRGGEQLWVAMVGGEEILKMPNERIGVNNRRRVTSPSSSCIA